MALNREDIVQLSTEELLEKSRDTKVLLKKMEFNHAISAIENPMQIRAMRRDVARLLTELRSRELNNSEN
ncbi:MAG: 50S ribosomal protein L29 [Chitinophagales bacterium]|nr:50S ribosomal protein L29 [Bacteroidota bacterium]MCB9255931.1 50S ribosomal protein L29 [Chitinophagales bacterium]